MRRHGRVAFWRRVEVERDIEHAMWSARVLREARRGAIVVAGPSGEVLSVRSVAIDGSGADTVVSPHTVRPDIRARYGTRWIQDNLGDAPSSVDGNHSREIHHSQSSAAPGLGPGTILAAQDRMMQESRDDGFEAGW